MGQHSLDLECRLKEWSRWYRSLPGVELGYPTRSVEGRVRDDGGVLPSSQRTTPENPEAEEVEKAVTDLYCIYPTRARVLRSYYFDQGTIRIKCKTFSLSKTKFLQYFDLAKSWLEGRLK